MVHTDKPVCIYASNVNSKLGSLAGRLISVGGRGMVLSGESLDLQLIVLDI